MSEFLFLITKQLLVAVLLILIFWGWGKIFLSAAKIKMTSFYEEFFFASTLGMTFIIIFISFLSILGIVYKPLFLVLLLGLLGLRKVRFKADEINFLCFIFLLLFPVFILTLYPPHSYSDDMSYHLPIAKSLLEHHKLILNPTLRYPFFPMNGGIFLSFGCAINFLSAQLLPFICLFLLSIGCFNEINKRYNLMAGFLCITLILSNKIALVVSYTCFIDMILALFITATIIAVINFLKTNQNHWLYFSSVFMGIAIGIKYPALIIFVTILAILLVLRKYKAAINFIIPIFLIGSYWYFRNIYYTGNPVWPFFPQIFGYGGWEKVDYVNNLYWLNYDEIHRTFFNFIKLPVLLTDFYEGRGVNLITITGYLIGIFLSFKNRKYIYEVFISFIFIVTWFLSYNLSRYLFPIIPIVAIISTFGYLTLLEKISVKKIKTALILILIFANILLYGVYNSRTLTMRGEIPISTAQKNTFLSNKLPLYYTAVASTKLKGAIYGLYMERMFIYCNENVVGNYLGENRYVDVVPLLSKPEKLYDYLKKINVQYLIVNKDELSLNLKDYGKTEKKLLHSKLFKTIFEDHYGVIYHLEDN